MGIFGPRPRTRETSDAERRANARERVALGARRGESPTDTFDDADLRWAFRGLEEELSALEEEAEQTRLALRERRHNAKRSRQVQSMTEAVLREWDEQARLERHRLAAAEARKRLGLDEAAE